MTLSTKIKVFTDFTFEIYILRQWAFIHALLSRVPFALAGLSCIIKTLKAK